MNAQLIDFIVKHENDDVAQLLLKHREVLGFPVSFVANQINGRRRAKEKLPTWYSNPAIAYPPQQNLEQCSSEATAQFKCEIVHRAAILSGGTVETIVDLTGGFGVDSYFFSRVFERVWHVEPIHELNQIASENHDLLKATNIKHVEASAEAFLESESKFDWLYIDPSRKSNGKKVVRLPDCEPDVVALLPTLFAKSENILIKTSPLLDLKEGIRQLPDTKEIWVVSVDNECKEVLFVLQKGFTNEPIVLAVNLPFQEQFEFSFAEEETAVIGFSEPQEFIYEPNASVLKAGAFKMISVKTGLSKIAMNTHFYTSRELYSEFSGRIFKNLGKLDDTKKQLPESKANIISRNHPLSPDQIKKKFKLKDGGEKYVLAFSGERNKFLLAAERVK